VPMLGANSNQRRQLPPMDRVDDWLYQPEIMHALMLLYFIAAGAGPRSSRPDLRLVHRRIWCARLEEGQVAVGGVARLTTDFEAASVFLWHKRKVPAASSNVRIEQQSGRSACEGGPEVIGKRWEPRKWPRPDIWL